MNNFGKPLIIIGAIILLVAFNMDVSVESGYGRVNNIGLMADRSKYLLLGALFVVAGLFVNFKNNTTNPSTNTSSDSSEIKCPFCAELIKNDAKLCKHCKSTIPESQSPIMPISITPDTNTNSAQEFIPEPSPSNLQMAPQGSSTINRSAFNKSYTAEFTTPLNANDVRVTLSNKLSGEIKGFQQDSLLYIQGKSVYAEATLSNIEGNKWSVKIDYLEEMSIWSSLGLLVAAIIISAVTDSYKLFAVFLIVGPIIITFRAIFSSRIKTNKIKSAIESFKQSVQATTVPSAEKTQSNIERTSSDAYALKLISIGNHAEEVKVAIQEILGLGINDTNDLLNSQPCIIISGLSASEITPIKYKLMKAGASVEVENC